MNTKWFWFRVVAEKEGVKATGTVRVAETSKTKARAEAKRLVEKNRPGARILSLRLEATQR